MYPLTLCVPLEVPLDVPLDVPLVQVDGYPHRNLSAKYSSLLHVVIYVCLLSSPPHHLHIITPSPHHFTSHPHLTIFTSPHPPSSYHHTLTHHLHIITPSHTILTSPHPHPPSSHHHTPQNLQGVLDRFSQVCPKVIFSVNAVRYNGKVWDHMEKLTSVVNGKAWSMH